MAEVLSQEQIDALLGSLQEKETTIEQIENKEPEKKVRKYDFNSPRKFTRERVKVISTIFDNYARIVTSQVNSLFRTTCEINVMGVEEQRYFEFMNALKDNDVLSLINVSMPEHPKNPSMIMHASMPLMLNFIDRMLGGVGAVVSVPDDYTYTEIEMALYQRVIRFITASLKDAWATYVNIDFSFGQTESNPSLFQEIGMDEAVVIVILEVVQNNQTERITVCMSGNLLMNIFEVIDRKRSSSQDSGDRLGVREEIMNNIRITDLGISARLGNAMITLEDVYRLQEGDVIDLGQTKDSLVDIYVEDQPWFKGQLGAHKKNVAVRIEQRADEEDAKEADVS